MGSGELKVFLSVGTTSDTSQLRAIEAIEDELRNSGLTPVTLGRRNEWSSDAPLEAIHQRMRDAHGTVVLALTRIRVRSGTDVSKVGAELPEQMLPTPWTQIETALAWTIGHPLLVLQERQLTPSGLFEQPFTWNRHVFDVGTGDLDPSVRGVIQDWARKVRNRANEPAAEPTRDVTKLSVLEFAQSVKVGQFWSATVGLLSLIIAAFAAGRW
jgi:hypothetical protein